MSTSDPGQQAEPTLAQRIITWKHWSPRENLKYSVVWVDIAKLDVVLQLEQPWRYVGFAGKNGIEGKYTGVDEFVLSGRAFHFPIICIRSDDKIAGRTFVDIRDGRHRFAWMRDHGAQALPVAVERTEANEVEKLVGSKERICRVNMWRIPEYKRVYAVNGVS